MARILVVGGYDREVEEDWEQVAGFGKRLGSEIILQGHSLLNACHSEFDRDVAEGAHETLQRTDPDAIDVRLRSWVRKGSEPIHRLGQLLQSDYMDWDPAKQIGDPPEPIDRADIVIFVRGSKGVNRAAIWADVERKPLLPVASFGGAAQELFRREIPRAKRRFSGRLTEDDFDSLNMITDDTGRLSERIVTLAERVLVPRSAIVCMSYTSDRNLKSELADLYENFKLVCVKFDYECERITELTAEEGIVEEIKDGIRRAGFVVVDFTELRPNVFHEYGFATGLGKPVVVTAREGTELPFNVKDVPTILWSTKGQSKFREALEERVKRIALQQGHIC